MPTKQLAFYNPALRLTAGEEAERKKLVKQLDRSLALDIQSKKDQAFALSKLRPFYSKPGCKGQWKKFLTSKGIKISTAKDLIRRYEGGWENPVRKAKPRLNKPNSGLLAAPYLGMTGKPFPHSEDQQGSLAIVGKEIVEAVFVLTADERDEFMEGVRIIGPEESLRLMFEAVVRHVELMHEDKTETVTMPAPTLPERLMSLSDGEEL